MLGSTIQHIGGVRRPLCLAQVTRFPLIKIAAEVASEIRTGARRPQKLPGARSIKPGTMTDQLVWQDWIFVPQIDHEILEGAGDVTARRAPAVHAGDNRGNQGMRRCSACSANFR